MSRKHHTTSTNVTRGPCVNRSAHVARRSSICLLLVVAYSSAAGQPTRILPHASRSIHRVVIEQAREEAPRSDTASVVELEPGHLMMVYHRYRASEHAGMPCERVIETVWIDPTTEGGQQCDG